jgi:hypothetical protein
LEFGDRSGFLCVGHRGVAADHLDFAVDKGLAPGRGLNSVCGVLRAKASRMSTIGLEGLAGCSITKGGSGGGSIGMVPSLRRQVAGQLLTTNAQLGSRNTAVRLSEEERRENPLVSVASDEKWTVST